tara:strand:+ start:1958 stop:2734 length:777 start_codon:yes stop_codon:yes gene_type:complete
MNNKDLKKIAIDCTSRISKENKKMEYSDFPFKHIVLDDFLDLKLAKKCLDSFPKPMDSSWEITNDKDIEIKKRSAWKSEFDIPENIIDLVRILNSSLFIEKIGKLLNISKLMPDPYFTGGGLNESTRGGLLDVHIDGNYHDASGLNRRVNAIYFLNPDWDDSWGGQFGLYDSDGKDCLKKISPNFNRLLVFDTSDISFHGLPDPLNCPDEITRKSIILYYYTKSSRPKNQNNFKKPHSALWKRKGLKDKKGKINRDFY